jgi:hypothetical protein
MNKTSTPSFVRSAALAVMAAAVLAACGGDGSDDNTPPVTAQVPASASASTTGFIAYLMALVQSAADTLEPVDVSAVTPPADDTSEPTPLN